MTALVLLTFIAVWAIIIGVLQLFAAVRMRDVVNNEWWLILSGLISIAFGVVLIAWPGTGALAVVWTIAWYAVCFWLHAGRPVVRTEEAQADLTLSAKGGGDVAAVDGSDVGGGFELQRQVHKRLRHVIGGHLAAEQVAVHIILL